MQDSFARARTRPKGQGLKAKAKRARDDMVSCIQEVRRRCGLRFGE